MKLDSLFFIAILPPENIRREINQLKEEVAQKFNSRHALRSPPHITLHMPFTWRMDKLEILDSCMDEINGSIQPFEIELKDFGFFPLRVVFVDVVANEQLTELQRRVATSARKHLKLTNANYKDQPFHPHVTIGFRDLKRPDFMLAFDYYSPRSFGGKFTVEKVALLRHDGRVWSET
jgi:2'-5' RNA ligase